MEPPFFSVVVPAYNRAALLPAVIASVQAQTYTRFELLIIDDGSTDDTRAVVETIGTTDPRIRYLYQQNAERGAARNRGLAAAGGTFVVFFDSDDEMKPDYLQLLQGGITAYPNYNFYAARYLFLINGAEKPSGITPVPAGSHGLELLLQGNPFSCNFCVRRQAPALVPFRESRELATVEDWMYLVENLQHQEIYLLDAVGVLMHQHDGRSMQQNQLLITRRLKATQLLTADYNFTAVQQAVLEAYSFYFCSIHAYLDNNRKDSLKYLLAAVKRVGATAAFLKAALKYLAGRKTILRLKGNA